MSDPRPIGVDATADEATADNLIAEDLIDEDPAAGDPTAHGPTAHGPTAHSLTVHGLTAYDLTAHDRDSAADDAEGPAGDLLAAWPADAAALARLHARLAVDASAAGTLDVAYTVVDTPVGPLLLAGTEHGLVRVAYAVQDHDAVLQQLADRVSARVLRAPGRLDPAARQLDEYFAGRRTVFELPLDLRLAHGFRRTVLTHLPGIAYGGTASYSTVAAAAGSPRAVRAVGSACATNPLPVVVPCHRVVRHDGALGAYVGGSAAKQALLTLETAS